MDEDLARFTYSALASELAKLTSSQSAWPTTSKASMNQSGLSFWSSQLLRQFRELLANLDQSSFTYPERTGLQRNIEKQLTSWSALIASGSTITSEPKIGTPSQAKSATSPKPSASSTSTLTTSPPSSPTPMMSEEPSTDS